MNADPARWSEAFQKLYCNPAVYDPFSAFHPISFRGALPFQPADRVMDDAQLIAAEEGYLANQNEDTRRNVIESYRRCGLLSEANASNVASVIDCYDADFFDLMGTVYANASTFICALRWYREYIARLEVDNTVDSSLYGVYASVGYCLYSMGLFAQAISWSKSCLGPTHEADKLFQAYILGATREIDGEILATERSGMRGRFTITCSDPARGEQLTPQIKEALERFASFLEIHLSWQPADASYPGRVPDGYPFKLDVGIDARLRHKMNLLFAYCGQADALMQQGSVAEATRLLREAALLEPRADFIQNRLLAKLWSDYQVSG